jgi:hypothetical protein
MGSGLDRGLGGNELAGSGAEQAGAQRPPVRFGHPFAGGGGAINQAAGRSFSTFVNPALGTAALPAAPQASMGLPVGLAALSPFIALMGKALRRNKSESE